MQYNPSLKALNLTGYKAQGAEFPMTNMGHTGKGWVVSRGPVRNLGAGGLTSVKAVKGRGSCEAVQPLSLDSVPPLVPSVPISLS